MNTYTDEVRNMVIRTALMLAVLIPAAGAVSAQDAAPQPQWQAWIGCWQPAGASLLAEQEAGEAPVLCLVPTSGAAAVEVVSLVGGEVVGRERFAMGEQQPSSNEGCSGWESATASADGRRVYRQSEQACEGGLQRRASGLMTMLPSGEWLDVQGVSAGGFTDVQAVRSRPVAAPAAVADEVAAAREGRSLAIDAARRNAAARLEIEHVVEAARTVHPEVIEAWLVEREQGFMLDARRLVELADAGVSERVIDLMVALSYPQRFAVNRELRSGQLRPDEAPQQPAPHTFRPGLGLGSWGYPGPGFGYGYGYNRGYGYGPGHYGPGYYGYGYGAPPVVIVVRGPGDDAAERQPARAVPGRGYTRGQDGGGSAAPARTPPRAEPARTDSGTRSGGSSAEPASSGSQGSGATRTARPRPRD
jgi:hypothetical protein